MNIHIGHISYVLGERSVPLSAIDAPEDVIAALGAGGIEQCWVHDGPPLLLAAEALRSLREKAGPVIDDVRRIFIVGSAFSGDLGDRSALSQMLTDANLQDVVPIGVTSGWCAGTHLGLEVASSWLRSSGDAATILLFVEVGADRVLEPAMSLNTDAAVALLVANDELDYSVGASAIVSNSRLGHLDRDTELLAYLGGASQAIIDVVNAVAGPDFAASLDVAITNNYSTSIVTSVAEIVGAPSGSLFLENIPRFGHARSCDNLINLSDARVPVGAEVLLLGSGSFQFGATRVTRVR